MKRDQEMIPKSPDGVLQVLFVGRVSNEHQDIRNIDASFDYLKPYLLQIWPGETNIQTFGDRGSGLDIDREEMSKVEKLVVSGIMIDLIMAEDLSRFYRDPVPLLTFLNRCVQRKIRVICPGDNLDTQEENWNITVMVAMMRHTMHIPDTKRRVKRTASATFERGGMVLNAPPGYEKLTEQEAAARTDAPGLQIRLMESARAVVREVVRLIKEDSASYPRIAKYLNEIKFSPGPRVKSGLWTSSLVAAWLSDPILHGLRVYAKDNYDRNLVTHQIEKVPNPSPQTKHYDVLAFLTKQQFDELRSILDQRSPLIVHGKESNVYRVRRNVPRSDTLFLRQQLVCGICGQRFYDGGVAAMRCKGVCASPRQPCWNHVLVKPKIAIPRIIDWLLGILAEAPEALTTMTSVAMQEFGRLQQGRFDEIGEANKLIKNLKVRIDNTLEAIMVTVGDKTRLTEKLAELERQLAEAKGNLRSIELALKESGIPSDKPTFELNVREGLIYLAEHSFAFGELMRRIMPKIIVQPVQAIDSGLVRPRLLIQLNLAALLDPAMSQAENAPAHQATIDAFTSPQPFRDREAAAYSG